MGNEEKLQEYFDELVKIASMDDLVEILEKHKKEADFQDRVSFICNSLLDTVSKEVYQYSKDQFKKDPFIKYYIKATEYLENHDLAHFSYVEFFKGNNKKSLELLLKSEDTHSDEEVAKFTINDFVYEYVTPFKSAFPGFWNKVYDYLKKRNANTETLEFCKIVPSLYESSDAEDLKEKLSKLLYAEDSSAVKELLGYLHYQGKEWGNAVSYFEQLEEFLVFQPYDVHFMMGYCYGNLKETRNEIEAYERSYKENPYGYATLNNLGYAYYKAKQYNKALDAFQECMDKDLLPKYAANNYVRTLLAMKRFKDAKSFIASTKFSISKALKDRAEKAESTNQRIKQDPELSESEELPEDKGTVANNEIDFGVKKQQFTQEKILEDELTARIESGMEIFGKKLKIYRRPGIYGRQFILPTGKRLDLLAEDLEGTLYIIELKKDSGYDDAYVQTAEYLDWFEKNWNEKVNVKGIICLNNPSMDLIKKVHADDRMSIFEYKISYTRL